MPDLDPRSATQGASVLKLLIGHRFYAATHSQAVPVRTLKGVTLSTG